MGKQQLRQQLREKLNKLSESTYRQLSDQIANQLFSEADWQQASVIGITISRFPEVDTYKIIQKAWEQNKTVVVPKCEPAGKKMIFRILTDFNELESVYFGLFEPIESRTEAVAKDDIDLLFVPGLAYSRKGYRIGFGGGYYDRFLTTFTGKTLSLAFSIQMVAELPIESHDIPVKKIITNHEVITIDN